MHINFKFANSRRTLRIIDGEFSLASYGRLCGRPAYKGQAGQIYAGWSEYRPISRELAERFLQLSACRAAIKSNAAMAAWEEAVAETGFGPVATAVFQAVAYA